MGSKQQLFHEPFVSFIRHISHPGALAWRLGQWLQVVKAPPKTNVELRRLSVVGSVVKDEAKRVFRRNFYRFRGCYVDQLGREPALTKQTVAFLFDVNERGYTEKVRVFGLGPARREMTACITKVAGGLTFRSGNGAASSVTATIELSLAPRKKPSTNPKP